MEMFLYVDERISTKRRKIFETSIPNQTRLQITGRSYKLIYDRINDVGKLKTFKYKRVYMPFPGPPAEKLPPPPRREFRTQNGTKSGSLYEQLSNPKTKCAKVGNGLMAKPTLLKSFSR
uniref:Uncharacterized protein n=1 Tax=Romanomermis culicivorax TaxID=13658 RepID=A0A915IZ47_ROMCU